MVRRIRDRWRQRSSKTEVDHPRQSRKPSAIHRSEIMFSLSNLTSMSLASVDIPFHIARWTSPPLKSYPPLTSLYLVAVGRSGPTWLTRFSETASRKSRSTLLDTSEAASFVWNHLNQYTVSGVRTEATVSDTETADLPRELKIRSERRSRTPSRMRDERGALVQIRLLIRS